ncbi:NADP-dependent oxidoreductase [Kineosporia succinea]|uniref:NADPH:quinone reductase-like Zn-dependent oxidoreductase n=1 Tax=Kineosporia succinea TaxID=84632 RepID=A0ABT9NWR5_9ACTN|nr:NADP-dependent oxidoreductase [Kineosporia succinea]MDP9824871.1 NADPH:quinone reductase-like Zn-dependent oxidoreductase [Kineosporia succinea]
MRALQFSEYGPSSVLHVADVPEPHAGPGQVRIAVRASGLTPADTYFRSGRFRDWMPLSLPHTLGVDAAGVVDEVGDGVTGTRVGDEVFGLVDLASHGGANAQYAVLALWAARPSALSWEESGGLAGNAETAQRVLDQLGVTAGETLLIEGAAGGVGSVATQFAVARGVTVIGTASPGNHDFLRELGALPVAYGAGLGERVRRTVDDVVGARGSAGSGSGPRGGLVDAVLDTAGKGSLRDLVEIAGGPERVVTIADLEGSAELGVKLSRSAGPGADPQAAHGLTTAHDLAQQGRLKRLVAGVFPLDEAARAHDLSETGHARGKIVLVP